MPEDIYAVQRERLQVKKAELYGRLDRVTANVRRGNDPDSKERAKELEDSEVVDALGNEARVEISKINEALRRMDNDEYGICDECGSDINEGRLDAHPYARKCIDCARFDEHRRAHS
ncbi:MAG: TraR/DksA family transcriptional regulator [Woeseiaceae bacterium]|nr:TraR/DksA family transcriptional regulator [Woeseiaceae bacterium]NIP19578.1 TraR/DksA family transcriptional regulator [Woeseiaceae bacterium]NIS88532.1 TraR/DksA family transcriptional regulator [Woeseiaceae bacterium]